VVKQHPLLVLFAGITSADRGDCRGALTQPMWGVLLLIVATLAGGWAIVRKRRRIRKKIFAFGETASTQRL